MNFSQRFGLFILILITITYVYFSFFGNSVNNEKIKKTDFSPIETSTLDEEAKNINENKLANKNIKIFLLDNTGNLRAVNRECKETTETSCFKYAVEQLISAPSKWERSKGFTSEIPQSTKILSIRESKNAIMIDLSSDFESGGGAESTYARVKQIIKTSNANTSLPVYLYINGKQANVIGGEGIMIKQPLNERSFDE